MPREWRSAVVGTGTVGEWHVNVLGRGLLPTAKLVAVCDKKPQRFNAALAANKLTDVAVYTDQAEMLRKEKLDIVHVCTPSGEHMDPALMAIEAGVNVICEKPMEIQIHRIDRMGEAADKKGVRLAGIFQNRWNTANRAIKAAADEGRFGTVAFAGTYTPWYRDDKYYLDKGGWRGTWKYDGGGAIMNQSVHAIDLLQWIAGPVATVSAYGGSRIHSTIETEDTLACSLQFKSGAFGVIMGTTAMYPGGPVKLEIGGSDGMAVSEGGLKTFKFRDSRPEDAALIEQFKNEGTAGAGSATDAKLDLHSLNLRAILDAWSAGKDAETAAPEARKAVAIIVAMYESVRKGGAPAEVR
jgi:UDP-N-acetyl-2-amino-2-deoxyglucuronate dehydrogenase